MSSISEDRAERLRKHLIARQALMQSKETQRILSVFDELGMLPKEEAETHQTPSPVRRCVASVVNKGGKGKRDDDDVSDKEKSKAFAVCWASHNKGKLSKGFAGKEGKQRKGQYKALLKKKSS